jgi:hypothetical protein
LGRPSAQTPSDAQLQTLEGSHFVEKLTDIIGVYSTPPQNAIVLCVDEKSQIQALDRTQPGLP